MVHVHLGERSVCCSIGIGGSFASQFITKQLGPAADSLTAAASGPAATAAPAGAAVAKEQAGTHLQKIEIRDIIRRFSELFVSQGSNPAVVFHLQPATAAAADAAGAGAAAAAADMQTNDEAAYISAWPLGAPEMLRRQLELRGEKLEKAQLQSASKDSVLLASSLPVWILHFSLCVKKSLQWFGRRGEVCSLFAYP
ncbi:hypothetical protein, conserved [Eimeria acervulina]|uniref:Uncharacterized protein n=1 Tax=Eimeria acervulina TaxID=5801 RepID=U6GHJ6_EIMAC|nr:hypothetical protein, conserved [Eimeria acervulina]CDI79741.1 hypothetical protein, conserved [Eimeria acervulina]